MSQKIARQPTPWISAPPTSGPSAIEIPTTEPQTPIARARSAGTSKVFTMMLIATGFSIVPPSACTTRARISSSMLPARLQPSEPTMNSPIPNVNTRRRPSRSAVDPANISRHASTMV